ncbi:hypothetical protein PhCBS80983_g06104 [Powellomyces hirtus]|uniref:Autophagy protein 5 n=1 Tax=Powellomyces hirtus TaxID=109895 RepID=A0A507DQE6_9FUNG|nr:hypothetical protein PhCBS80983_g06104 [Powellomyces hirtus]
MQHIDSPVAQKLWDGQVPLRISLHPQDASALNASNYSCFSQYLSVHRFSYLPLIASEVRRFFVENTNLGFSGSDAEVWFECQGIPLKWHYPVGLLCDYQMADIDHSAGPLPWHITVHFLNFPADKLIRVSPDSSIPSIRDAFMSMVKEADFMRHGTIKKVMGLSKQDQTQLWDSLVSHSFEEFWHVNSQLLVSENTWPRYVPLRIYVPGLPVIQEPIPSIDEETDQPYTLRHVLASVLPQYFKPRADGDASRRGSVDSMKRAPDAVALLHGIEAPLGVPLVWLSQNCSYPDNFLHIVIRI